MPALIPNPDTYKKNLENSDVKTRWITQANGVKACYDEFQFLKNGHGLDKNRNRSSPVLQVFGCHACRWVNTELCPHKGDVTHMKHHAKGICSQRLSFPIQLHEEGVKMTGKQMLQVRALMDAEYFDKYMQDEALKGKRNMQDCFPWVKLRADILKDMRKQDEGSKLQVIKGAPDPVVMGELMRLAREKNITGTVSDIIGSVEVKTMDDEEDVLLEDDDE